MSNIRRSKMAEGIFEKLSGYKATSAGVDPADKPDKNVINALKEIGFQIKDMKPKKVTDSMMEEAYKIIVFRCVDKLPEKYRSKMENWEIGRKRKIGEKPLKRNLDGVRKIQDVVYERVSKLVKELNE